MNPTGRCLCGCGMPTRVAPKTRSEVGWVKGEPIRFVHGHHGKKSPVRYEEVDRGHETPCWEWRMTRAGSRKTKYGYTWDPVAKKMRRAHVVEWERENGPIPDGMELDHLCNNKLCIRPDHVEPVTHLENVRRYWRRVRGG